MSEIVICYVELKDYDVICQIYVQLEVYYNMLQVFYFFFEMWQVWLIE